MWQTEEQASAEGEGEVADDVQRAGGGAPGEGGEGLKAAESSVPVPTVVAYLDGLVGQLQAYIPAALEQFEPVAIHQARVATRRLGAALGLLGVLVSKKDLRALEKVLKKLRRRLGPHRDLDVLIDRLREFGEESGESGGEVRVATEHLVRVLSARRDALRIATLEEGGVNRVLGRLAVYRDAREELVVNGAGDDGVAGAAYRPLIAAGVHAGFDEFSVLSDLLSHQMAENEGLSGIDPHELRIAGKHLRYSLELAAEDGAGLPADVFKDFKKMQDALGLWHDQVVLAETAMEYLGESLLLHRDADLAAAVLGLARESAAGASGHLKRFAELWVERGQGLTETVRRVFPLSVQVR